MLRPFGCTPTPTTFGAQFVEDAGRDVVGRAMGAIDHDLQAAQVEVVGEGALAELDVAPGAHRRSAALAEPAGGHAGHRLIQRASISARRRRAAWCPAPRRT
jgi:hypothetical protein